MAAAAMKGSRKRAGSPQADPERYKKKTKLERRKKADEEFANETEYYFKDGLRCVKPYYFTFTSHAKGRWVGFNVYDVFCKEFQAESPEYYQRALQAGKVSVNGKIANMATVLHHNDIVSHRVHRHEPPVTAQPLSLLHVDEELVVVDKPASIPIHPCGRYRHNTVLSLLKREHNFKDLHTVHRLDRLTSGLLILTRSLQRSRVLDQQIRERKVTKEYICRVQGEFPSSPVSCEEPILVFSHKLGLSRVDPKGKPCSTFFTRLSYNGETSVVKCVPKTGRMHQIRVHLQWLGYPILNDPLYNHPAWEHHGTHTRKGEGQEQGSRGSSRYNYEDVVSEITQSRFGADKESVVAAERKEGEGEGMKEGERKEEKREETGGTEERGREGAEEGEKEMEEMKREVVKGVTEEGGSEGRTGGEEGLTDEDKGMLSSVGGGGGEREEDNVEREGEGKEGEECTSNTEQGMQKGTRTFENLSRSMGMPHNDDTKTTLMDRVTEKQLTPLPTPSTSSPDTLYDPDCTECHRTRPTPSYRDLFMCLHALSYKGEGWCFTTPLPPWAAENWKLDT